MMQIEDDNKAQNNAWYLIGNQPARESPQEKGAVGDGNGGTLVRNEMPVRVRGGWWFAGPYF